MLESEAPEDDAAVPTAAPESEAAALVGRCFDSGGGGAGCCASSSLSPTSSHFVGIFCAGEGAFTGGGGMEIPGDLNFGTGAWGFGLAKAASSAARFSSTGAGGPFAAAGGSAGAATTGPFGSGGGAGVIAGSAGAFVKAATGG